MYSCELHVLARVVCASVNWMLWQDCFHSWLQPGCSTVIHRQYSYSTLTV